MDIDKMWTKQDLADRWDVTTVTIDRWVKDKIISPIRGIPSIRFNPAHILELEGTEISKLSPLERRRLLREIKDLETKNNELKKENEELKEYVKTIIGHGVRFIDISKEVV